MAVVPFIVNIFVNCIRDRYLSHLGAPEEWRHVHGQSQGNAGRGGSRNFNVSFAKAAAVTIAEVDEIVEVGEISPEDVDLPGVFVSRVVKSTVQLDVKNLPDRPVTPHAENGMLNYGRIIRDEEFDPDVHDAGGFFVSLRPGAAFFESVTSFEIARSGRLDAVVLGAYQVAANGDLANWTLPTMTGGGIGGAMDLAVGARQVIALLGHADSQGNSKLVESCDFGLTAPGCVDTIVTDLALLTRTPEGFRLDEIARGFTVDEVRARTRMPVTVADQVGIMQDNW